ncbi:hypothetical protein EIN_505530 [Entamoeba invadens IP1]|uniref:Leucine rich repeat containing protein BspA family protein n=1 Tax=Entamoeba invadens IP1 TaxID=370355 RepID=A0A0A1U7D6_ENTIV|nr:hypothetical protein EIN_505530 [Entamoeba invadens IP1]ELP90317.1 hypothetical protein EIN_505530 [Entamoeba invadens IP1]|eukprot:XP_004257088.1 hypothetical protein EIN_505530 [Entamoeba invadens IP1]
MPLGLTNLGIGAFQNVRGITSIHLTTDIDKIKYKTFSGMIDLVEIVSPLDRVEIDDFALEKCDNLVRHPKFVPMKGAWFIDKYLAKFCELKEIVIWKSITEIPRQCYCDVTILESIIFPQSISYIGTNCFRGCTNLKIIEFDPDVIFGRKLVFANLPFLMNINLPNTLTKIRNFMFKNCSRLENITIPVSVKKIGDMAFENCKTLKNMIIPKYVSLVGVWCFKGCDSLVTIQCSSTLSVNQNSLRGIEDCVKFNVY